MVDGAKRVVMVVAITWLMVTAAGCATGEDFQRVADVEQGKGVLYVYRPKGLTGWNIRPKLLVDGREITPLRPGQYTFEVLPADWVEVSARTETVSTVMVQLEPGEERFVRQTMRMGVMLARPHLEEVPREEALEEIQSTTLAPK